MAAGWGVRGGRYGSSLRAGWRDILDCITRLHKLGLLPHHMLRAPGEGAEAAAARLPKPSTPARSSSTGSLFSRAINRCAVDCRWPRADTGRTRGSHHTVRAICSACPDARINMTCAGLYLGAVAMLGRGGLLWQSACLHKRHNKAQRRAGRCRFLKRCMPMNSVQVGKRSIALYAVVLRQWRSDLSCHCKRQARHSTT